MLSQAVAMRSVPKQRAHCRHDSRSGQKASPVILTSQAATEALRVVGAHRIALIHPPWFSEEADAKGKDYFRNQGFEVVFCERTAPDRPFTEVPPAEVYEWVKMHTPREAEAVLIGGNGLRAVGTIDALEENLGRPFSRRGFCPRTFPVPPKSVR